MKINGRQITATLKEAVEEKKIASSIFADSLFAFEGDNKEGPRTIAARFKKADDRVAHLEALQQLYNSVQKIKIGDKEMSLAVGVKKIGGAGRLESMWSSASSVKKSRYSYGEVTSRSKDEEHAGRQISIPEAIELGKKARRVGSDLRTEVARANFESVTLGEGVFSEFGPELFFDE